MKIHPLLENYVKGRAIKSDMPEDTIFLVSGDVLNKLLESEEFDVTKHYHLGLGFLAESTME